MKIYQEGDLEIRYKVEGEQGPVLVLFHGFGGGTRDFQDLVPYLADHFRVVIPSLKCFFSHDKPITFSEQVEILNRFIKATLERKNINSISYLGQSYGATLSLALREITAHKVLNHILINPMPFRPFHKVNYQNFKSAKGRELNPQVLAEIAQLFRIGTSGQQEVHHFNERKLSLIKMAMERFHWIDMNEPWEKWEEKLGQLDDGTISEVIYSSDDLLFSASEYEDFSTNIKAQCKTKIAHHGHLLLQDKLNEVIQSMKIVSDKLKIAGAV